MKVTFKQINTDKDISEKDGFGVIVISSVFLAVVTVYFAKELEFSVYLIFIGLLAYTFFGRLIIRKLFSDWVKKEDIIGTLDFCSDHLMVKNNSQNRKVNYNELESIYIHYNHVQGGQFAARDIIHNGLAVIKLNTKKGEQELFKFLIENKIQISDLKPIWKNLYISGVFIREKMEKYEVKTIMFDAELTDKKIKTLKDELNVNSFY